jgi:hypothetical protein
MSDTNYRKMLKAIVDDKDWNLNTFGKRVGYIETNVTDMSLEEAKELLQMVK